MGYFFIGGMVLVGAICISASLDGLAKAIRNLNVEVRMGTVHVKVEEKGVE